MMQRLLQDPGRVKQRVRALEQRRKRSLSPLVLPPCFRSDTDTVAATATDAGAAIHPAHGLMGFKELEGEWHEQDEAVIEDTKHCDVIAAEAGAAIHPAIGSIGFKELVGELNKQDEAAMEDPKDCNVVAAEAAAAVADIVVEGSAAASPKLPEKEPGMVPATAAVADIVAEASAAASPKLPEKGRGMVSKPSPDHIRPGMKKMLRRGLRRLGAHLVCRVASVGLGVEDAVWLLPPGEMPASMLV